MRLLAAVSDPSGHYARLRRVFERSALAAMPRVEIEVLELPAMPSRQHAMAECFLAAAERAIERAEPVAVCDLDLLFLRSIEPAWNEPFDVAVTVRDSPMRYNTGLWFYRPAGAAFVRRWCGWVRRMLAGERAAEVKRYGGIDQAALAAAVAEGGAAVLDLPCRVWNATQSEWAEVNEETRVVHVKSALRRACLGLEVTRDQKIAGLVEAWRRWET